MDAHRSHDSEAEHDAQTRRRQRRRFILCKCSLRSTASCHRACRSLAGGCMQSALCAAALPRRPQPTSCSTAIMDGSAVHLRAAVAERVMGYWCRVGIKRWGRHQGARRARVHSGLTCGTNCMRCPTNQPTLMLYATATDTAATTSTTAGRDRYRACDQAAAGFRLSFTVWAASLAAASRTACRTWLTRMASESSAVRIAAGGRTPPQWSARTCKCSRVSGINNLHKPRSWKPPKERRLGQDQHP